MDDNSSNMKWKIKIMDMVTIFSVLKLWFRDVSPNASDNQRSIYVVSIWFEKKFHSAIVMFPLLFAAFAVFRTANMEMRLLCFGLFLSHDLIENTVISSAHRKWEAFYFHSTFCPFFCSRSNKLWSQQIDVHHI